MSTSTPAPAIPGTALRGGAFRALAHRNFALFFWGQFISIVGTWSQMLAVSWLIWRMTGSALWLGIANFALHVPCIFLGLPAGHIADRHDRLRLLTFMQALCMLQAILLAWLTLTGAVKLWQVIGLGFFLGSVYAFEMPIRQAFVMDLVGKRDLLGAISLVAAMFHFTRMLGPTVAGAIVAWKGEGVCFAFNAVTFLALIAALMLVRRGQMHSPARTTEPMLRSIKEGLREAKRITDAIPSLALVALLAGIGMQFTTLLPMFADRVLHGGAVELGWLMGASGAGSLAGALWLARRKSSEGLFPLTARMAILFSATLILLGLISSFIAALPAIFMMGLTLTIAFSCVGTLLQNEAGDHMRGRMMSLYTVTFMGFFPFGSLAAGILARSYGSQATISGAGIICLIASAAIWGKARRRTIA
ncbi:MAG: MFS transporter [Proteobacteria bacterium]|nr:MFS transporter [Pseudomonadota bacterium]